MISASNTNSEGDLKEIGPSPFVVTADYNPSTNRGQPHMSIWNATARNIVRNNGSLPNEANDAVRTAQSPYMVGLSERLLIQTTSALPWMWRRICFTFRGDYFRNINSGDPTPGIGYSTWSLLTTGPARQFYDLALELPSTQEAFINVIFKGQHNADWTDLMTAKVDTRVVSLRYDKVFKVHTGNDSSYFNRRKLWMPMNKTLMYESDESGDTIIDSAYSVDSKGGLGDYYVVDIVVPGFGGTATDAILIDSNATLYWHER